MAWLIPIVLALVNAACLGLVLLGLPGTWLMLTTCVLLDWWSEADLFAPWVLWVAVALAASGEIFEFTLGARGAKKAGAGKRGAAGALLGGIAGALLGTVLIPVPLIGSLAGAGLGAFAVASLLEQHSGKGLGSALKAGRGAALGQVQGTLAKLTVGGAVWVWLTLASLPL